MKLSGKMMGALCLLAVLPAMGQQSAPTALSQFAGIYSASSYAKYQIPLKIGNAQTGFAVVQLKASTIVLPDGRITSPWAVGMPLLVGSGTTAETVTVTSIGGCTVGQGCSIGATFAYLHYEGEPVQSGSSGLQEAINDAHAHGGGEVDLDGTFVGTVASAVGYSNVSVKANYLGALAVFNYIDGAYSIATSGAPGASFLGDSVFCGYGDPSYTADPTSPQLLGPYSGPVSLAAAGLNGYSLNFCHTGDQVADLTVNKLLNNSIPTYLAAKPTMIEIGTNDANPSVCGLTTGCEKNYQYGLQAAIGWAGIADTNKLYAQACGSLTNWTSDTALLPGLKNAFVYSNVSGASQTCTFVTGKYLSWMWAASSTATGCATLTVDGVTVDTECSTGFNGQTVTTQNGTVSSIFMATYYLPTFGLAAGSHQLTVLHNASTGYFEWGGFLGPDLPTLNAAGVKVPPPGVCVLGIPEQYQNANATATATYDTIASTAVAAWKSAGLNVAFASVRSGLINYNSSVVWNSGTTNPALHPTRVGAAIMAQIVDSCISQLQQ